MRLVAEAIACEISLLRRMRSSAGTTAATPMQQRDLAPDSLLEYAYWGHADVVAASCKSGQAVEASQVAAGAAKPVRLWV